MKNKTIKYNTIPFIIAFLCALPLTAVFAAQDVIGWTVSKVLPMQTEMVYTLTNHSSSTRRVSFTTNSSAVTVNSTGCDAITANGGNCSVTVTLTPNAEGNAVVQLILHYGNSVVPLPAQKTTVTGKPEPAPTPNPEPKPTPNPGPSPDPDPTPDPTPNPTPVAIILSASPMSLHFTTPGTAGAQSINFSTTPSTPDLVIMVSDLPQGVTGASSCTTDTTGSCRIVFTAGVAAYGNKTMTVSAADIATPPSPVISVENTTIDLADITYISATGKTELTLKNTGNFDWQTTFPDALQLIGDTDNSFGVHHSQCTEANVAANMGSCTISFTPKTYAYPGDGMQLLVASNARQNGNGNVYINGGLSAEWSTTDDETFTQINQTETLILKNTSSENVATINSAEFTNKAIHDLVKGGTCGNLPRNLAAGKECTITYTSQQGSYGSDSVTVTYDIDSHTQTVESSKLTVGPTTLKLTPILTSGTGSPIASGGFITLEPNQTKTQQYTISGSPFDWQDADLVFMNAPIDNNHLFLRKECSEHTCTVTFNTNVTNTTNPSIKSLNFNPDMIVLNATGSNLTTTASWNVAPVVGQYMQGGVVYWVGPNDANYSSAPGYRHALVAAVADVSGSEGYAWCLNSMGNCSVNGAQRVGLFTGINGEATGLSNTKAICAKDGLTDGQCKTLENSYYPATAAAQAYSYTDTFGKRYAGDWFLPAAMPFVSGFAVCATTNINKGELCELFIQKNIINATAMAADHGGNIFSDGAYLSSSEKATTTNKQLFSVYFDYGDEYVSLKNSYGSVRPIRAFAY
jgi:hypothetical protein